MGSGDVALPGVEGTPPILQSVQTICQYHPSLPQCDLFSMAANEGRPTGTRLQQRYVTQNSTYVYHAGGHESKAESELKRLSSTKLFRLQYWVH